jgi:hypothetical protein|tara:strand:- start:961 stop:1431 length:471 start_codon:yes stop_codon:yes gene_type:complete
MLKRSNIVKFGVVIGSILVSLSILLVGYSEYLLDVPVFSQGEAIAMVKERLVQDRDSNYTREICNHVLIEINNESVYEGREVLMEKYRGDGIWEVTFGDEPVTPVYGSMSYSSLGYRNITYLWLIYETSLTVESKGTHEYDAELNGKWKQAVRFKC